MRTLESLSYAQRERLAFIDFSLNYFGQITRADLIAKFQTGLAAATRDLASYKELAPNNLVLVHQSKTYHCTGQFIPLFEHNADVALSTLSRGFGDGLSNQIKMNQVCVESQTLNSLSTEVLSKVMRAITQQQAISIHYISLHSGLSERIIIPHSLANNGSRWHIRGYDRLTSTFRDFIITRIKHVELLDIDINKNVEMITCDKQWNRIVDLILIPHPKMKHPTAIELDYSMEDGKLGIECRAALVGHFLSRWWVDCSTDHVLDCNEYHLALHENAALYGVESAMLAPGYRK